MSFDKSTWSRITLNDVVSKKEENNKANAKDNYDRFLKVEHLDAESLEIKRWASQSGGDELPPTFYKIFRKGQVLFPTRNPHLRRTALASFDGICGEKTLTLEPNKSVVHPDFIPFLFHSDSFYAHTTSSIVGSTNPHVRWRDVAKYEFSLPEISEQLEIVKLLTDMEQTLKLKKTVLEKLKTSFKVEIENSINRASKEFFKMSEVVKTRKGVTYKSSDYSDKENGTALLNLKSIEVGGGFNKDGIKYFLGKCQEKHYVRNEDLIIACTDITRGGNVVGYPLDPKVYQDKKMLFTMDLMAIEITDNSLLRDFLFYALKASWVHWFLFAYSPGTTVLHLDTAGFNRLKIPKLEIEEQKRIITNLKKYENSIELMEKEIDNFHILQKTIINKVF